MQHDVIPGKKFGGFEIGMILDETLAYIQSFPVDFSRVCLKYHPMRPFGTDITLDLDQQGFLLRFDPRQQRLRQVEIYNVQAVGHLSYKGYVFCRPHELPTCHRICERFGPSVPGEYCARKKVYKLHYPGISFYFPIPDEYARFCPGATAPVDEYSHFVPLEFPGGLSPVASRIILYSGGDPRSESFFLPPLPRDSTYFEEVQVIMGHGINFVERQKTVTFQSSVQDVLAALGAPDKVFYKEADAMQLHMDRTESSSQSTVSSSDYFFNYFSMGIDFLFDQHTHFVKKIVLHSNFPCHFDFNRYRKCNFRIIDLKPTPLIPSSSGEISETAIQDRQRKLDQMMNNWSFINCDTHWHDALAFFPIPSGRPVVDNRGYQENPFGPRRFYAFKGIIFEVMRNDYIASILLFNNDSHFSI